MMTAHQLFLSEGLASAFLLSSFCFGGQVMLGGKRFRGALDLFWSFSSQLVDEFDNVGMLQSRYQESPPPGVLGLRRDLLFLPP
jgi:hypothetical protein